MIDIKVGDDYLISKDRNYCVFRRGKKIAEHVTLKGAINYCVIEGATPEDLQEANEVFREETRMKEYWQ